MINRNLINLFKKKTIIGALHLSPSPGFLGFDGIDQALDRAQFDLNTLIDGGVDAVIFENNYDLPHQIKVGHNTTAFMTRIISRLNFKKKIPFGISVLWNDYQAALSIAQVTGADFVRVPAFVDSVKTNYGIARAVAKKTIAYRKILGAEKVAIFADVQVKHAEMLNSRKTLRQSLIQAERNYCDAVIITGKWTGDAPVLDDLMLAKKMMSLPVIVGSGAGLTNVNRLFSYADGAIVSTSLKYGERLKSGNNPNLKSFNQRFDIGKVKAFVGVVNSATNSQPIN